MFVLTFWLVVVLGNWDATTQEMRYSGKMVFPGLRVMAGYSLDKDHHLVRGRVEPPDSLKKQLFPWVDEELDKLDAHFQRQGEAKATAKGFLTVLKNQRRIILQDLAAMVVKDGDRRDHFVFKLPVFQSEGFSDIVHKMKEALVAG